MENPQKVKWREEEEEEDEDEDERIRGAVGAFSCFNTFNCTISFRQIELKTVIDPVVLLEPQELFLKPAS